MYMEAHSIHIGPKEVFIVQKEDGHWEALCDCRALKEAGVRIPLTASEAREIISGRTRHIQEVLPNTPPPLREIFVTGTTPAEFDLNVIGQLRAIAVYMNLGYFFESDSEDVG